MNTAFYSGLSGLSAYSGALNIIGNNLANLNTTGFKGSEISFEDLVTRTFGGVATNAAGNPMQTGLGILPNSISGVFTQGSIQSSQDATNVALEGNGFFVVGDTAEDRFYTRAGNFFFNDNGELVNPAGKYVLGYTSKDANGNIMASGPLTTLSFPANTVSAPQETSFMEIYSNLNVRDAVGTTYTASSTVYDSKGAPHTVTITFTHTGLVGGVDQWTYAAAVPDADTNLGTAGSGALGTGTLSFDASGTLIAPAGNVDLYFTTAGVTSFANGADAFTAANPLSWRLYQTDGAILGAPIITGYPIASSTSATNTDGYPPGNLTSVVIDGDGILQGVFSNGQVEELAQLGIAQFNNPKGLIRLGRNLFAETNASGTASIGAANTGGRGAIVGSSLEASNVDMASEFTKMLIYERGYQANSKIITTSDTISQTAIGLIR